MLRKITFILCVLLPCAIFATDSEIDDSQSDLTPRQREWLTQINSLNWLKSGTHKLPDSDSTITLPEGYIIVIGEDAKKEREMGEALAPDDIEAVVNDENFDNTTIFQWVESGYISIDDWGDIDPRLLLESITENTELANVERRKRGYSLIHVVGWLKEPTLSRELNTVYWTVEARDDLGYSIVNSVALSLGRHGYERIVWVTDKGSYVPFGGHLEMMLKAHSFDPTFKYEDYVEGDKMAGYGIAALVAASVGGKVAQATGLLAVFKKFIGIIFAVIAGLFYKLRNIFSRNKKKY